MMKRTVLICTMAVAALAAVAGKPVVAAFSLEPPMTCENCEKKVKGNLRFEKGVKGVTTSIKDDKVEVSYDPAKTSPEKLIEAFGKIGYDATVVEADSTAVKK